jgi:outer membrane protein OmpA-like peptidoglycan-associated protein
LGLAGVAAGGNFEDFPYGGQVYAGWMFNNIFGIEGRWSDSGDGESDILLVDGGGSATDIGDIEIGLDGWTAYGVANWPVAQRWDLFAKAGYTDQNADLDVTADGDSVSASDDDSGFAGALGARWRFARHWAATVEGEYLGVNFEIDDSDGIDIIDEPWRVGLNVEYWFGGNEIPPPPPPPPPARVAAVPPPPPPPAPKDSDGDGVVDPSDQCPDTPKGDRVGPAGCSCDVSRQLSFKTDSAELSDADKLVLDEMAENLTRLKFISGVIEGHTDSTGSEAHNQRLSERRAQAAADYLVSRGISGDRLEIVGRGESEPVGDNATAEGRAQNRRVVAKRTDCDK